MLIFKKFDKYNFLVSLILGVMFLMMIFSAVYDSGTMDELAHIPSAYSYLKYQDMRLNPEHPPLLKDIAGLPLQFLKLNFPVDNSVWQEDVNGQWRAGSIFLYELGNDADQIIFWSRIGPMILTIIFGAFIFKWTKELFNIKAALVVIAIFAFSPTILAHGRLVTTDIAAGFGFAFGIYYFLKWLKEQTYKNLIKAGLAFGIAQVLKFSLFLLVPFFVLISIIWVLVYPRTFLNISRSCHGNEERFHKFFPRGPISRDKDVGIYSNFKLKDLTFSLTKTISKIILIFIIGYLFIVWPIYGYHVLNYPAQKQLKDTTYNLGTFSGGKLTIKEACTSSKIGRCPAELTIWAADKGYIRALAQYSHGLLMVIQRGTGGNTTYFLNEVNNQAWRSYFPIIYIVKEQLSLHLMTIISIVFLISFIFKKRLLIQNLIKNQTTGKKVVTLFSELKDLVAKNFEIVSMIVFIAVYFFISIKGNLNIGIRHLIPSTIFIYILTAGGFIKWFESSSGNLARAKQFKNLVIILLLGWYVLGAMFAFPHFLPYFNELVGTKNGYKIVVDSNYDWGQDLKRLANWVSNNNLESIGIHYFGAGKPEYYLKDTKVLWWWDIDRLKSESKSLGSGNGLPKYFAISGTFAQYAKGIPKIGFERRFEPWFDWIKNKEPIARAGYSIFIYELE